ncbi:MAG: hypothetical protein JXB18_11670 [Sedimentisphaerales bacterium]|nr:hypothetical protein [Sedimentisphaerales bacterium]
MLVLLSIFLSGCSSTAIVVPLTIQPQPAVRVAFDSFINVHYDKNRTLGGWLTTRDAVETTLKRWYEQVQVRQRMVDGTAADLAAFFSQLPGPEQCDISVVYLGSIQDVDAVWEFVNGTTAKLTDVLALANAVEHPFRIVILDACHAAAVNSDENWTRHFAAVTLLAAGRMEKTYQFEPSALAPIDVEKHYPRAWGWAQIYLPPDWKKQISFLGLMWMETAAQTRQPPSDAAGWKHFCDHCGSHAQAFRQTFGRRWGSRIQTLVGVP